MSGIIFFLCLATYLCLVRCKISACSLVLAALLLYDRTDKHVKNAREKERERERGSRIYNEEVYLYVDASSEPNC